MTKSSTLELFYKKSNTLFGRIFWPAGDLVYVCDLEYF